MLSEVCIRLVQISFMLFRFLGIKNLFLVYCSMLTKFVVGGGSKLFDGLQGTVLQLFANCLHPFTIFGYFIANLVRIVGLLLRNLMS